MKIQLGPLLVRVKTKLRIEFTQISFILYSPQPKGSNYCKFYFRNFQVHS